MFLVTLETSTTNDSQFLFAAVLMCNAVQAISIKIEVSTNPIKPIIRFATLHIITLMLCIPCIRFILIVFVGPR
jgi:hypothetical protein